MTALTTTTSPIVTSKNGQAFANSRDVAEFFGKAHRHVLDSIDALVAEGVPDFRRTLVVHPQNGQTYRNYDMTKDGFTLLAMGFTGAKALQFKLAYIAAFNEMEAKLHEQATAIPNFHDPVAAARAWADQYEQNQIAQQQVEQLKPLASVGQRAVAHDHSLNCFMRTLPGVNTTKTKQDLKAHNYLYRRGGAYRVYSHYQNLFFERLDEIYGTVEIFPTAAGKAKLLELYKAARLTMKKGCKPT